MPLTKLTRPTRRFTYSNLPGHWHWASRMLSIVTGGLPRALYNSLMPGIGAVTVSTIGWMGLEYFWISLTTGARNLETKVPTSSLTALKPIWLGEVVNWVPLQDGVPFWVQPSL